MLQEKMSSLDADGKTSTCYRVDATCKLSSCQVATEKMLTCYRKDASRKMQSAGCQLLSESCQVAIGKCCMRQEKMSSLDADGKTSTCKLSTC